MTTHRKSTLMGYRKEKLVEYCLSLEAHIEVSDERFEIQYQNCMKIVEDMNLINKTFKKRVIE